MHTQTRACTKQYLGNEQTSIYYWCDKRRNSRKSFFIILNDILTSCLAVFLLDHTLDRARLSSPPT